jgi:hypothetical protein
LSQCSRPQQTARNIVNFAGARVDLRRDEVEMKR